MTSISTNDGTGQTRIQLWSDALGYFRESPLFGIGMENYRQFSSHVAHNSFLHCYVELGLIGGSLFVGAFYLAARGMFELRRRHDDPDASELDPELKRLHPFLMAMLVGYTIGICFLSRTYIVPTYMMLGLAVVYLRLHSTQTLVPITTWNRFIWPRLAGVSVSFLVGAHVFVRMFVNW
jgi:O-antigen ligase